MTEYYVYLLASRRNGTLYVGVTNDLARRISEHKAKAVPGFTKKYGVDILVWYETLGDINQAIAREKQGGMIWPPVCCDAWVPFPSQMLRSAFARPGMTIGFNFIQSLRAWPVKTARDGGCRDLINFFDDGFIHPHPELVEG